MISIEDLSKHFSGQTLFENVSFKLNPHERIGLVGRNGHGKTTLFRLIIGEEIPDSGAINIPRNYRIGYVRQHMAFSKDTILEEGMKGLPEENRDQSWIVERILTGLGFTSEDMKRPPEHFSGGFQVRLNLTKVLVSEPDLLLLDEPTNYLDITSIRWIERFLLTWPRELILITHDRGFMDTVVTHTVGIHRKKLRKIQGSTEKYYRQVAQEEEIYEKTRLKDERRSKEITQFITRFRAKARLANLVQSRIKLLDKKGKQTKLEKIKTLDFSFQSQPYTGKYMLDVEHISFAYDRQQPLITDFHISVRSGERICIIGKNGKGKTTLLKLLSGHLTPQNGGLSWRSGVVPGSFEQTNIESLVATRTVEEEIQTANAGISRQAARNVCGAMMFPGDDALKKISVLSGGEKSRVLLGKLLVTPANLLFLDEPTHHLDMDACDALLSAIDNFSGTVVIVTHNEMFLHALAERLVVFESDTPYVFDGTYQRFLEKEGWQDEIQRPVSRGRQAVVKPQSKLTKRALRRKRSDIISDRARTLKPIDEQIEHLENEIEIQEKSVKDLNDEMQQATQAQDGARIAEISRSLHRCQAAVDRHFESLENLLQSREEKHRAFEEKLARLDQANDA